jgi:hypothetical protein
MATKANPYYTYRDPGLARMFSGLSGALFPQAQVDPVKQSAAIENEAQARNYDAQARGRTIENDVRATGGASLAEFFRNGGRMQSEPLQQNPAYTEHVSDFSLGAPVSSAAPQPMFNPVANVDDKLAGVFRELAGMGFKPDDFMKMIGQSQYLNTATGANPDSALALLPFVGGTPNQNTALTTGRQDAISGRDAAEALRQATTTTSMTQAGADRRNAANIASRENIAATRLKVTGNKTGKAPSVPSLSKALTGSLQKDIAAQAEEMGLNADPAALRFLVSEAGRMFQDPNSEAFRNPQMASLLVMEAARDGTLEGITQEVEQPGAVGRFLGKKPVTKTTRASATGSAPIATTPDGFKLNKVR